MDNFDILILTLLSSYELYTFLLKLLNVNHCEFVKYNKTVQMSAKFVKIKNKYQVILYIIQILGMYKNKARR